MKKKKGLFAITRFVLTPIFLLVRIYCWVWDYDYYTRFKHPELMD